MTDIPEPPESADWNAVDATYLTMMVAHHRQALDLAELAETRAVDPRVRTIADAIDSSQGREIIVMATWLVDHDLPEPTLDDVEQMAETGGMPGMLSVAQVDDLAASEGASFDRTFLEDMIQHHQGAIGMAHEAAANGEDVVVIDMATEVAAGQGAEITRMRTLLEELP